MKPRRSLKTVLNFYLLLAAWLPLTLISGLIIYFLYGHLKENLIQKNFYIVKALSGEMERFINEQRQVFSSLVPVVEDPDRSKAGMIQASLTAAVVNWPLWEKIQVLDDRGRVLFQAPAGPESLGLDLSRTPAFLTVQKIREPHWSPSFISMETGEPNLTYVFPWKKWVLVGTLNLKKVQEFISRIQGRGLEIGVLDSRGGFIAHTDQRLVRQQANIREEEGVRQGLEGVEGTYFIDQGQEQSVRQVAVVPETGWPIVVQQPLREALAPINQIRVIFISGLALGLLVAFYLARWNAQRIYRPLGQLTRMARRISEGDYQLAPLEGRYREFDELAEGFQAMSREVEIREAGIREALARFQILADNVTDFIWTMDNDFRFTFGTPSVESFLGYTLRELPALKLEQILAPESLEMIHKNIEAFHRAREKAEVPLQEKWVMEMEHIRKDGSRFWAELRAGLLRDGGGKVRGLGGVSRDITILKKMEEKKAEMEKMLRQSQKMEAIGTLAGGIAHDFNNILGGILGYAELALMDLSKTDPVCESLEAIQKAGLRARDLVRQILAFSRKSENRDEVVEIGGLTRELLKLIRSTTPSSIEIFPDLPATDLLIRADPVQIHQVILNLCTNAVQSMKGKGGCLRVGARPLTFDPPVGVEAGGLPELGVAPPAGVTGGKITEPPPGVPSGDYVQITIQDTGTGIDPAVLERIFDPFFTTKGPGEGTGLGLSVVHGIINGYGGAIQVTSEPGQGSVFNVLLPRLSKAELQQLAGPAPIPRGKELILLVDDERAITDIGRRMLEKLGYEVETRNDPREALQFLRQDPRFFNLVITDLTMPGMSGLELASEVKKTAGSSKIIISSGYQDWEVREQALERGVVAFLDKPLKFSHLARTVREVLDGGTCS
ncbi:MAG: response regulator [Deltaproteobacteria bacterium]|nr:response regulator [Deltaproteobacteria bacterium]